MLSLCALSVAFSPGLQQCPRVASAAPAAVAIRAPHPVAALDPQQLSAIVGAVALGGGAVYYNSQKSKSPSPPPAPKAAAPPKPAPKKAAPKKDTWGIKNRKGFRGGVNMPKPKTPKRKLWKPPAGWEDPHPEWESSRAANALAGLANREEATLWLNASAPAWTSGSTSAPTTPRRGRGGSPLACSWAR